MTTSDLDVLSSLYPALADLPPELHRELRLTGQEMQVAGGRVLFDVGHRPAHLPLFLSGSVRVVRRVATGRDVLLYRAGPGDFCVMTAAALLGDAPHEATGTAESALAAILLPKAFVERLVEQHARFRRALFSTVASRLSRLMMLVEAVAATRLDQRLATLLVQHGPTVRTTHQHLADELATAREVVSRILESFETAGLVRLRRGQVDVVDPHGLGSVARSGG